MTVVDALCVLDSETTTTMKLSDEEARQAHWIVELCDFGQICLQGRRQGVMCVDSKFIAIAEALDLPMFLASCSTVYRCFPIRRTTTPLSAIFMLF